MNIDEAKKQFVSAWGSFGSNWGINRTMAQIHALLMVSTKPMNADEVMEALSISRGNTNMNIRELINWGLVDRVVISGERKEFFTAEKDIWKVAKTILKERKKRELEPMTRFLENLQVKENANDAEVKAFNETIKSIKELSEEAEKTIDTIVKADENWFWNAFLKILK
ncbi:MAG: transcriptional regulator [Chitinophagaceae bacterium]|jgi:DNA-binding transcriptional regulator GbsR (MarR family)|nr:transcriptional regulator [Chitinophagaceae bacterium]